MGAQRSRHAFLLSASGWFGGLVVGAAVATPIADAEHLVWKELSEALGNLGAAAVLAAGLIVAALGAATLIGQLRLPVQRAQIAVLYAVRMIPFWIRDAVHGGAVGSGRGNRIYSTLREFESEDNRRVGPEQLDFGVHWHADRRRIGHRITWLERTGELVAVQGGRTGDGPVELIARIQHEWEVERRLADWGHASFGGAALNWVRRRARGWNVPLPPAGQWWLERDSEPLKAWPSPPPPSLGRETGAYIGSKGHGEYRVEVADEFGSRPLYHYVDSSPTGFAWGYFGAGPTDLARSLLADRVGYIPRAAVCMSFHDHVVSGLPDTFALTFQDVDVWIDAHRELFALDPRAEPFDPYAAGGAY
jgi:hypothetical protein